MPRLLPTRRLGKDVKLALGLLQKRPFSCLVQVTNRCNMRCSFCDFWPNGAPPKEELTVEDFARLSGELAGLGTFVVSIEGGEPLGRPDIVEVVRAFARQHVTILFTNGWYVTADLARALFEAGLTQASVSIDYPDAERHDRKRGLPGTTERAWQAVRLFRAAADVPERQVAVMTVLMADNWRSVGPLLELSAREGVAHWATLLATHGYRRNHDGPDQLPPPEAARHFERLWRRFPHFRYFRDYFRIMERFLAGGDDMPTCRAGAQSFNVDHLGNVSPCIEKIDRTVGNVRKEPLAAIHERLLALKDEVGRCQDCWTACRGMSQLMGNGGTPGAWRDLVSRMRSS